eukprot:m.186182 g.186182  ORF g.186182 m.186182 type:complete len:219 (-) comp16688_c0_seq1:146-802(-)
MSDDVSSQPPSEVPSGLNTPVPLPLPDRTPEDLVAELSADYAPYLRIDDNEHLAAAMATMAEDVDQAMARLEEFRGLVSQIDVERESFLSTSVPLLQANCDQLRTTYDRITQLEAFVGMVKRNVQQMDDHVSAVEREFMLQPLRAFTGKISGLFKMGSSGVDGESSPGKAMPATPPPTVRPKAPIPKVFKTKTYFRDGRETVTPATPMVPQSPTAAPT